MRRGKDARAVNERREEIDGMLIDFLRDHDAEKRRGHTISALFDRLAEHEKRDEVEFAKLRGTIDGLGLRVQRVERDAEVSGSWQVQEHQELKRETRERSTWIERNWTKVLLLVATGGISIIVERLVFK